LVVYAMVFLTVRLTKINSKSIFLGILRGFAFVTFHDYSAVNKVLREKQNIINDKRLDVRKAVPKGKNSTIRFWN